MAGSDIGMLKNCVNSLVASSNDVIEFKLVRQLEDLKDDRCTFKPAMSHQVFGDSESIFGYHDLKIQLYYSAGRLTTYFGISYSEKVTPDKFDGIQADEIFDKVSEKLQPGFHTNLDDFCSDLEKDANFVPFGDLKHSFTTNDGKRSWEIYMCEVTTPNFQKYHERLQTFVLWFIDAASFIDADDDHWRFFLVYEKYHLDGNIRYAMAGYATVYEYYAYPDNIRPRISQMLVLPPFQRIGLGAQLLENIYKHYTCRSGVVDITVEDPSEEFQRLRDFVDARNCRNLQSFQPHLLEEGFRDEMVTEARAKLKLNKKQTRRIYEILRLNAIDIHNDEQYRRYRLNVKNRLNIPYQKELQDLKKFKEKMKDGELQATLSFTDPGQRLESLDREYRELEAQYQRVLQRLTLC
ncbi:histone acetyltransferase type B catalytic subunit [Periplaneta americana]|uniref:histone acetyltransferase type B catalytic subunit n=1 Tax=Periplaneta americana TaxID=6978 RepID=UPI0037E939F7